MYNITHDLWNDEAGFIVSAELALVGTLCVLGLIVGLTSVRDAVNCELTDLSSAICSLDQSYYYTGFHSRKWPGCCTTKAWTAGSAFTQQCKTCVNNVDFVTTTNVAPCTTCPTAPAIVPTPAVIENPAPVRVIELPKIIEQPKPAPVPCPAPAPAAAPTSSVPCNQPVSAVCAAPVTTTCPPAAPAGNVCPTPVIPAANCNALPVSRPVLVPQTQVFNW